MSNYIIDPQRGPHIRDYSDQSQDRVVIYSNSGWWAAKGCGYTTSQMAGVYTRDDAYKRAGHCGPEKGCCFYDVPADHVPTLQAEVERLRAYREADTLRAQLKASQTAALDYHRRWQEAEAKMVALVEARNAAMKQQRDAVLDAIGKADQGMNALIAIGHKLSIENAEQFHTAEYAQDKIVDKIVDWWKHYFAAVERAGLAEGDVKVLREALEGVMTSTRIQAGICGAVDTAVAALAATEPKGEQGCQSKS